MEISKKLDYAIRMLAEVAQAGEGEVVSVRTVAEKEDIPYSFARTIQHEMVRSGLLNTTRGPHGGMTLAIDPKTTTLFEIVQAIEGPIRMAGQNFASPTSPAERRWEMDANGFVSVWFELETLVHRYLSSVTLHQLVIEKKAPSIGESCRFDVVPIRDLYVLAGGSN